VKNNNILKTFLVVGLMLALAASFGFAQTSKGVIAGTVTDASGAVIPGANVVAKSKDNGAVRSVTSGATGSYRMEAVEPGTYTITVKIHGFQTLNFDNLKVAASMVTPADLKLEVGGTTEVITVEATNNGIETESGTISGNIGTTEILQIPTASLNPIELVLSEPGVTDQSNRGISNGVNFSVDGSRPRDNNFLIDGQDNNDNSIQGQAFQPTNAQAISEVSILTNSYSAEFGRGGASVTNVVFKGGTNRFHGSGWEYYDGSGLNAYDPQTALFGRPTSADKARFDTHTFGFSLGGPIVKDKLFFFFSPQWQKFYGNESGSPILVPTASSISTLQSLSNPNAALLAQYFSQAPHPGTATSTKCTTSDPTNPAAICLGFATVTRTVPAQEPDTQYNVRLDYSVTKADTVSLRYLHDHSVLTPDFFNVPASLNGFDTQQGGPSENLGTTWTHTFDTRAVNEFRASWGHFAFAFAPTPATVANPLFSSPTLSLSGISNFPTLGVSSSFPQGRGHQTYQVQDGLTINRGSHILKMGADIARILVADQIPFNSRGTIGFASGGGFTSLGNFLDNFTGTGQEAITFGNPSIKPRMMQEGFYFQDTWKVKPNFTLDLGVRYEFANNPENYLQYPGVDPKTYMATSTVQFSKVKEDGNNFAPRIGISYTPHFWREVFGEDKTVIRAGYGMFYDSFFTNILDNTAASSPNAVAQNLLADPTNPRGTANALAAINTLTPVLSTLSTVTTVDSRLRNPLTHQWNVNIERQLPGKVLMTIAYTGNRGERLFANDQINPKAGYADPTTLALLPRLNPARGSSIIRNNTGDSIYHGASAKLERKFSHGLLLRGSYTYGHAIDNTSEVYGYFAGNTFLSQYPQNPLNRAAERASSNFNVAQRFAMTYVWEVPGVNANQGLAKVLGYATKGWQLSGTGSLQSGSPLTYSTFGFDTTGNAITQSGLPSNGRPFLGNASAPLSAVGIDGAFIGATPGQLYDLGANNAAGDLVPVTPSTVHFIVKPGLGDIGRNTATDKGTITWNTAISRSFKITEGHAFQVRGDFFNILNHPNNNFGMDNVVGDVTTPDATKGSGNGNTFMNPFYARNGFRKIRVEAKYTF
jgi:outer membrane receptor protein involved in Fe transport